MKNLVVISLIAKLLKGKIMSQIKEFIEKAISDTELMAKLDELSSKGAGSEELSTLASEYGFAISKEEIDDYISQVIKSCELGEEDLENVAGGGPTQNRYDPKVCPRLKQTRYECVGFMHWVWCDHYRMIETDRTIKDGYEVKKLFVHKCVMGGFNYYGDIMGNPMYFGSK